MGNEHEASLEPVDRVGQRHDAVHVDLSAESVDGELMRTYEGWLNLLAMVQNDSAQKTLL